MFICMVCYDTGNQLEAIVVLALHAAQHAISKTPQKALCDVNAHKLLKQRHFACCRYVQRLAPLPAVTHQAGKDSGIVQSKTGIWLS